MLVNSGTAVVAAGISGAFGGVAEALASWVVACDGSFLVDGF